MRKTFLYCPAAINEGDFTEVIFVYRGNGKNGTLPAISEKVTDKQMFTAVLMLLKEKAKEPDSKIAFNDCFMDPTHQDIDGQRYYTTSVEHREIEQMQKRYEDEHTALIRDEDFAALIQEADDFISRLKAPPTRSKAKTK